MHISTESITLKLREPFRIAHGLSHERKAVIVRLEEGLGEASIVPYYKSGVEDVLSYVETVAKSGVLDADPMLLEDLLSQLPPGPEAARAAIDMALHDLWGKRIGMPLYRLWGLNPARVPPSSFTLGIPEDVSNMGELREKAHAVRNYPLLKLKVGVGDVKKDEEIVRTVREQCPEPRICIDANGAWGLKEAARVIPRLARYNVVFIEQPLQMGDHDLWHQLRRWLPPGTPPLIADESVHTSKDISLLAGGADGINIKLSKCGGLREARRMIELARALGMKVMLGCTVSTSIAVTAAAHIAPLVDFVDLDGNLGLVNDPYTGVLFEKGLLRLPSAPGLGVVPREV